jgi:hypothetical protein
MSASKEQHKDQTPTQEPVEKSSVSAPSAAPQRRDESPLGRRMIPKSDEPPGAPKPERRTVGRAPNAQGRRLEF